jgi:thioesterase domain-containing protein
MDVTNRVANLSAAQRRLLERLSPQATVQEAPARLAPELFGTTIVPLQPRGTRRPLFVIHATDGSVGYFRHLAPHLGDDQPLFAIQSAGLGDARTPYRSIEEQAAHYIDEIKRIDPSGPHLIAGYCMGGLPAFEIGQQLLRRGERPGAIVNISPIMERDWTALDAEADLELRAAHDFVYLADKLMGIRMPLDFDGLRAAPDRLAYLLEQATIHQCLPSDVEVEGFRRRLDVYRANLHAMRTYHPRDVRHCPLEVLLVTLRGETARLEFNSVYTAYLAQVPAEDILVTRVHADPVGMINGLEPDTGVVAHALRNALAESESGA